MDTQKRGSAETVACQSETDQHSASETGILPTDSMVSVRLSDSSMFSTSDSDHASHKEPVANPFVTEDSFFVETNYNVNSCNEPRVQFQGEQSFEEQRVSVASVPYVKEEEVTISPASTVRSRSDSSGTLSSTESAQVDWDELEKSEEQAPRDEGSDESTAFLLARLEQENNALITNPKAALARARSTRKGTKGRPPSIQQLKKLVNEPSGPSLRYSMVPEPPPMTELEFWAALVNDYPRTAQRLPTLTSNKIRSGIPPPLRGVVWMSIAGSRDHLLEEEYDRLCGESSPYEGLIGKDIGRSFPGVEMFRDPSGEGQQMLGRVLKCFSLYDLQIGYCQGLGLVVGPLLMHMGEKEAYCVLVRLMEHYDLRSCFLPDLSGLHLRIYQFQHLLSKHLPKLTAHLEMLQVEPLYVSQWFLSFFAVTCPLPMLLRIYDVILTEGASETLMRVALSLMRRNEKKILVCTEFEDVMSLLLSRALWDTYGCNADELVNDFVGLTGLVTRDSLEALEGAFRDSTNEDTMHKGNSLPNVSASAARFLGRFWTGANAIATPKVTSPTSSLTVAAPPRPASFLRRTPSKQSMASTLNSIESNETHLSSASTEATSISRDPSADCPPLKGSLTSTNGVSSQDRDLHSQIEDLLTALSDMQREHSVLVGDLQKEREGREEDRAVIQRFIEKSKQPGPLEAIPEGEAHHPTTPPDTPTFSHEAQECLSELEIHFNTSSNKRSSLTQQTKLQMREELRLWKDQYEIEAARSADIVRRLEDEKGENARRTEQFRGMRSRMQETHQDKQRLEKIVSDLKTRRYSTESEFESIPATPVDAAPSSGGLREFKLGRAGSMRTHTTTTQPFAKRSSSLGISTVLATENHKPPNEDALLLELVSAKTSEAVARQELEEVKSKLDSLRKMLGGGPSPTGVTSGHRPSPSEPCVPKAPIVALPTKGVIEVPKITTPTASGSGGGGFFSGWGKRTASNPAPNAMVPEA